MMFPAEEWRRLCKDEKSYRELVAGVQEFLALSASGAGREYWSAFVSHTSDLILEIDATGKIINVHASGELGQKKQFYGRNLKFFLPRLIGQQLPAAIQDCLQNSNAVELFLEDDPEHPFVVLSPVLRDAAPVSALVVFPAARYKMGMKKRINESEKRYHYIFDNANDGILITDPETHCIVDLNSVMAKRLGYPPGTLMGMRVEDITPPQAKARLSEFRNLINHRGQAIFETLQLSRDGQILPVEISSKSIRYHGKPAYLNFVRDISDRKRAQELLARKGEELNAFVYRASHDLKGPIATIRGLLNVASTELRDPNALYYLGLLNRAAVRLDNNLTDLIQITTISRVPLHPAKVDLNELASEVLHELSGQFNLDDFTFTMDIRQKKTFVSDRRMVRTILQNLLSNAMKYSQGAVPKPVIGIRATFETDGIVLRVTDNGPGIPEEARERVFDMFYRADNRVPGSGLGLTILKSMVQKLSGQVSIHSPAEGGAEFRVKLPPLQIPSGDPQSLGENQQARIKRG